MKISVHSVLNSDTAIDSEQGRLVREHYGVKWKEETLLFDFTGVTKITPSFLSQALLPLLNELTDEELSAKVTFQSKPPAFEFVWSNLTNAVRERVRKSSH